MRCTTTRHATHRPVVVKLVAVVVWSLAAIFHFSDTRASRASLCLQTLVKSLAGLLILNSSAKWSTTWVVGPPHLPLVVVEVSELNSLFSICMAALIPLRTRWSSAVRFSCKAVLSRLSCFALAPIPVL